METDKRLEATINKLSEFLRSLNLSPVELFLVQETFTAMKNAVDPISMTFVLSMDGTSKKRPYEIAEIAAGVMLKFFAVAREENLFEPEVNLLRKAL